MAVLRMTRADAHGNTFAAFDFGALVLVRGRIGFQGFGDMGFRVWGFGDMGFRDMGFRDMGFRDMGFRVLGG